jgi:hypothetical protein
VIDEGGETTEIGSPLLVAKAKSLPVLRCLFGSLSLPLSTLDRVNARFLVDANSGLEDSV